MNAHFKLTSALEFKFWEKLTIQICISRQSQIIVKFFKFVYFLLDIRPSVTQVTSNATSSGKIHFITKYFNARWGFLVRVLLYNKPYIVENINKLEEFYDNLARDTA